jgi:hypothetical protein
MRSFVTQSLLFVALFLLVHPALVRSAPPVASEQSPDNVASIFKKPDQNAEETIITGVNASVLICTVAKEHGLNVVRDRQGPGEVEPVTETTPPTDRLSAVRGLRHDDLERWGPRFTLKNGDYPVGSLQIGVFADPNAASRVFVEQITYTSMGPNKELGSELGDQAVGWWNQSQQGFRRILLRRTNVVVSVGTDFGSDREITAPAKTAEELARAIDSALRSGSYGVVRGKTLRIPRFVQIQVPGATTERTKVSAQVRIAVPENPQDENSKEIELVRALPLHTRGLSPEEKGKPDHEATYQLTYITAGCVVISKEVTIAIRPPTP